MRGGGSVGLGALVVVRVGRRMDGTRMKEWEEWKARMKVMTVLSVDIAGVCVGVREGEKGFVGIGDRKGRCVNIAGMGQGGLESEGAIESRELGFGMAIGGRIGALDDMLSRKYVEALVSSVSYQVNCFRI